MSIIKKLKPFIYQLITPLIIVTTLIIISIIIINYMQDVPDFKKFCESIDGIYFEIDNVTCEVGHLNCWRVCETEDRQFTLDEYYSSWKILG